MKPNVLEGLTPLLVPLDRLTHLEGNARRGDVEGVKKSLIEFGQHKALVCRKTGEEDGQPVGDVLIGNHTLMAARELGWDSVAVLWTNDDPTKGIARALVDNRLAELGGFDADLLADMLAEVYEADADLLTAASYTEDDLLALLVETAAPGVIEEQKKPEEKQHPPEDWDPKAQLQAQFGTQKTKLSLFDRFMVPPFTVLNARDGWWVERKKSWLDLGIEGELGREDKPRTWYLAAPAHHSGGVVAVGTADKKKAGEIEDEGLLYGDGSTSIFDPVLTELAYRWFSPPGGKVLDPFAGGSVRGIIASKLGRHYTGIELRPAQVEADRQQAIDILLDGQAIVPEVPTDCMPELTPVQRAHPDFENIWLKREDLYAFAGVRGAKVRACTAFIEKAKKAGVGVVTAGARQSPQVNFVAQIAHRLGVRCRVHVPSGPLTPELLSARAAGARVVQHDFGYNTVIVKAAREDAQESGWVEIPYGMESQESVDFTAPQVVNVPPECTRIVNAVGSGMTLAGILHGLVREGRTDLQVLGVCVGRVPEDRLDKWAPEGWRDMVELVDDPSSYESPAEDCFVGDVQLDAYYEAKCKPYLQSGDLFWLSAIRPSAVAAEAPKPVWIEGDALEELDKLTGEFDVIFSCPPYGDLEVYSDDPRDLSTMEYHEFLETLAEICTKAARLLRDDSFAVLVVGDYRSSEGYYHNFPGDVVWAMETAGFQYLNEAILVTQLASLPIRVGRQFDATRKMGKTHQNVVIFCKGDAHRAADRCGPIVSVDMEETE